MRKAGFWVVLLTLVLSSLACTLESNGTVGVKPHPELKPEFVQLADDSAFVGTYEAVRTGYENPDKGTFTLQEFDNAKMGIRCGTKFAQKIVLGAKKGYHWTYYESKNLAEGWFLEKDQ